MKNYHIKMYWKGLKGEQAHIGEFLVSQKTLDKLEKNFKSDISIDVWDDTKQALHSYAHIVKAMKETEYGKIAFKNKISLPLYQPHILASLKEATGVEWHKINHRRIVKPRFIEEGGTYEWWLFCHISQEGKHVYLHCLTVHGTILTSGMHTNIRAAMVNYPDYDSKKEMEAIGQTFKEKFQK